ncbi:hypothetical protein C4901_05240 [Acidiferrobacter sp. SPIII_3]|nr:hypothetical protein C4901_05240 [Acidiferrobacter sp. SPIII_3]
MLAVTRAADPAHRPIRHGVSGMCMTCEVAVMNKCGMALAADSVVAVGDGDCGRKKIYYTAEKLFSLSPDLPVAIMTYGPAAITGAPWETAVKVCAQKLWGLRFDPLVEYARDLANGSNP